MSYEGVVPFRIRFGISGDLFFFRSASVKSPGGPDPPLPCRTYFYDLFFNSLVDSTASTIYGGTIAA